jgi:type I restriction enzyme S subunit
MEPHSVYKESGSPWIGEIPSHWNIANMRWLTRIFAGGTPSKDKPEYWEDGTIPWLNSGSVNQGVITVPSAFISNEGFNNSSAKWIPKGSVVMALAGQGKTKGTAAYLDLDTTCNQSMAAICPNESTYSKYLYYYLKSEYSSIRGLAGDEQRDGLNLEMIAQIPCPIPTTEEQEAIASFLDHKTKLIDDLIAKKQRLIELKKEERAAIINQAVTRGLDRNLSMKNSGIDWIGEIPEHWDSTKIKHMVELFGRIGWRGLSTNDYVDDGFILLGVRNITSDNKLSLTSLTRIPKEKYEESPEIKVQLHDILLAKTGATIGKCCVVEKLNEPMTVNAAVNIFRAKQGVDPKYFMFLIASNPVQKEFQISTSANAQGNLFQRDIREIFGINPPLIEQIAIASYLDGKIKQIDEAFLKINFQINLLKEYKTTLISEAVTGKIKIV